VVNFGVVFHLTVSDPLMATGVPVGRFLPTGPTGPSEGTKILLSRSGD